MKLLKFIPAAAIALTALIPLKAYAGYSGKTEISFSGDNTSGYTLKYALYELVKDKDSGTMKTISTRVYSGSNNGTTKVYMIDNIDETTSSYYWKYAINGGGFSACPTATRQKSGTWKTTFMVTLNTSRGTICEEE